jgi:aminopeptidase N
MPLTLAEARARSADLDQVSYSVELDLTNPARFYSIVAVWFRSRSGTTFLDLAGGCEVAVTVDGEAIETPVYDGARLALEGLAPGELHEVTVTAFLPYVTDGEGMHTFTDPVDYERYVGAYLGVDLTQRVFACFDQPDVKATVSLTVLGEPGWTVLANGQVLGVASDRWRFAATRPIPINQFVVCAGPWSSITWVDDGREFGWHARKSLASALERDFADLQQVTMSCFAHYARIFTAPYEFGSYHQIFVPGQNWGAQETPGCVMYRDELLPDTIDSLTRQSRASTIAHEMAHMWFGNLATMRWYEDIWLNESFADYLGYRVASEAAGYPNAPVDFEIARKPSGFVADGRSSTHPVAATANDVPDSAAAASNFDAISYAKGNALIRQLATWLGDEQFFTGVNTYLHRYAFANAGLDDFVDCLAAAAPHHDVVGWAQSWLCTTGFDTIEVIDTEAGPAVRRRGSRQHSISVVAYDDSLALLDVRHIEVGAEPVVLPGWHDHIILPNAHGETFARAEPRTQDDELLRRQVSRVADPIQRAQIWSNAFARLHTRELSPLEFFATVRTQLPHETEPSIVRSVIGWTLGRGLQVCRSTEEVQAGFEAVATACRARLSRSTDAADSATTAFVDGAVRAGGDSSVLHGWHEQGHIEGVPLSVEQRWVLIWRLVELGAETPEFITANVSPKDSAQVRDWAERARAAVPNAHAKRAAWSVVEDERVSNRRLRAVLDGLWSAGRGSLPAEQVTTYLTNTQALTARCGPGFGALLGSCHPGLALSSDQLQALSDSLSGELEPRLRRQWQDWYDDLTSAAWSAR